MGSMEPMEPMSTQSHVGSKRQYDSSMILYNTSAQKSYFITDITSNFVPKYLNLRSI